MEVGARGAIQMEQLDNNKFQTMFAVAFFLIHIRCVCVREAIADKHCNTANLANALTQELFANHTTESNRSSISHAHSKHR